MVCKLCCKFFLLFLLGRALSVEPSTLIPSPGGIPKKATLDLLCDWQVISLTSGTQSLIPSAKSGCWTGWTLNFLLVLFLSDSKALGAQ